MLSRKETEQTYTSKRKKFGRKKKKVQKSLIREFNPWGLRFNESAISGAGCAVELPPP